MYQLRHLRGYCYERNFVPFDNKVFTNLDLMKSYYCELLSNISHFSDFKLLNVEESKAMSNLEEENLDILYTALSSLFNENTDLSDIYRYSSQIFTIHEVELV